MNMTKERVNLQIDQHKLFTLKTREKKMSLEKIIQFYGPVGQHSKIYIPHVIQILEKEKRMGHKNIQREGVPW